eukprot:131158-Chlamydomonas_euryale.AAC.8
MQRWRSSRPSSCSATASRYAATHVLLARHAPAPPPAAASTSALVPSPGSASCRVASLLRLAAAHRHTARPCGEKRFPRASASAHSAAASIHPGGGRRRSVARPHSKHDSWRGSNACSCPPAAPSTTDAQRPLGTHRTCPSAHTAVARSCGVYSGKWRRNAAVRPLVTASTRTRRARAAISSVHSPSACTSASAATPAVSQRASGVAASPPLPPGPRHGRRLFRPTARGSTPIAMAMWRALRNSPYRSRTVSR